MVGQRTLTPYVGVRILRPQPESGRQSGGHFSHHDGGDTLAERLRIPSPLEWALAPEWLTVDEACYLSGWDKDSMLEIIDEGGVDLKDDEATLIDKESLIEYQEAAAEYEYYFG